MNGDSTVSSEDDFKIVIRKRGSRGKRNFRSIPISSGHFPDHPVDHNTALRRIYAAKEDFESSDYFKSFVITLNESVCALGSPNIVEILCLGLGHIGECMISRYQLALLLCLKDIYNVKCFAHDPIFYSDECDILKKLDYNLLHENLEGKYPLRTDGITIVYLPHCPKQLTNNFLWKNWGVNLHNCVLICNSFIKLIESQSHRHLESNVPFILNICSYTREYSLVNSFKYNDIFNDLAIHIFPKHVLNMITGNFWRSYDEPVYCEELELITKHIIEKLNIKDHTCTNNS